MTTQDFHPPVQRILICVGNAGRQLLLLRAAEVHESFERSILVARPVVGLDCEPADQTIHYVHARSAARRHVEDLVGAGAQVSIFGAAGGRSTAQVLLALAPALSQSNTIRVVITSPFSWESRDRYRRALYVRFRLKQMRAVQLNVVVCTKIEKGMPSHGRMDEFMEKIMSQAWHRLEAPPAK